MYRAGERLAVERADHWIAIHARIECGDQTLHLFGTNAFVERCFRAGTGFDAANWRGSALRHFGPPKGLRNMSYLIVGLLFSAREFGSCEAASPSPRIKSRNTRTCVTKSSGPATVGMK